MADVKEKPIIDITSYDAGSYNVSGSHYLFVKSGSTLEWATITDVLKLYFSLADNTLTVNNATNIKLSNGTSIQGNRDDINTLLYYVNTNVNGDNAGLANSVFVNKSLGSSYTDAMSADVTSGNFKVVRTGMYWETNGIKMRVMACDPFINCGDNMSLGHHILVMPDTNIYNGDDKTTTYSWNTTNTTDGGYENSYIRKTILQGDDIKAKFAIFGDHITTYRSILCNAVADGKPSAWEWTDAKIELPTEQMVYGSAIWSMGNGNGYSFGIQKAQLPAFQLCPRLINTRQTYWLQNIMDASQACCVGGRGVADYNVASDPWVGVRPFVIVR